MIFATPALVIAGVLATIIPIALHFFFRRQKNPIEWAAMDLLMQAIRQTTRRRHIEKITLLILRCLVVLLAGMAIAGPLLQNIENQITTNQNTSRELVLILDDGIAQQTISGSTDAFSRCRAKATEAVDELREGDRVGLILTAGARSLVWPPTTDISAAKSTLLGTQVSDAPSDIEGAIDVARDSGRSIGIISDFRRGSITHTPGATQESATPKDGPNIFITPPTQVDISNTQITAFEPQAKGPLSPRNSIPLRIKLRREGGRLGADQSRVEIVSDDNVRSSLRIEWNEGQVDGVVEGTSPIQVGRRTEVPLRATLTQQDAQPADNSRFAIVATTSAIRVGIIDRAPSGGVVLPHGSDGGVGAWIERALRPTDNVDIETETIEPTAISTQRCKGIDAVIVIRPDAVDAAGWKVLSQGVKTGLIVLIVPPTQTISGTWSDGFLKEFGLGWSISREATKGDPPTTLRRTDIPHPLLLQISSELPDLIQPITVGQWFAISVPVNRGEIVLTMENGSPLLVRGSTDGARGSVLFFAAPPELGWTNLPAKPLMVPLFQELIRQSVAQVDQGRHMNVGSERMPNAISGAVELRLFMGREGVVVDEQRTISVDSNGALAQPITLPGVYAVIDGANRTAGWIVVNIDPSAASTQLTSVEEITAELNGSPIRVSDENMVRDVALRVQAATPTTVGGNYSAQNIPIAKALRGESLAVWFFGLLMVSLLVETWLARRSSTGATTPAIKTPAIKTPAIKTPATTGETR